MAPRQLSESRKRAMQDARVKTRDERVTAEEVLKTNSQFVNPKFWRSIDAELLLEIEGAIEKAKESAKKAKIARLEAELAALKG